MALNEMDNDVIHEVMEKICIMAKLPVSHYFMETLEGFTRNRGIGGEAFGMFSIDFYDSDKMDGSDIEYLGGRRFDGVTLDVGYDMGGPPAVFLSYQEFYDILCEYVEKAIKDKDEAFQNEAREYLLLFKEKHDLE